MSERTHRRWNKKTEVEHRGMHDAGTPPNSFDSLMQSDVDIHEDLITQPKIALETDVFLLADGNIVLLHPTDAGVRFDHLDELERLTLEELTKKLNQKRAEKNQRETGVPTIEDYIRQSLDRGIQLYLDIKGADNESSVRAARALVQRIHQLRESGLFEWRDGMTEGSEEYVRTYPENNLMLHCLSLDAMKAAKEEMARLDEHLPMNLAWVPSVTKAKFYVDMVDSSIDWVQTRMGAASREEVMKLSDEQWVKYGVDMAAEFGCKNMLCDVSSVMTSFDSNTGRSRFVDYAHSKGISVIATVIKSEAQEEALLAMGVDKVMFEPTAA